MGAGSDVTIFSPRSMAGAELYVHNADLLELCDTSPFPAAASRIPTAARERDIEQAPKVDVYGPSLTGEELEYLQNAISELEIASNAVCLSVVTCRSYDPIPFPVCYPQTHSYET